MKSTFCTFFALFIIVSWFSSKSFGQFSENQKGALSAQVHLGSQGIGADLRYGLLERVSGRIGGSVIPIKANNVFTVASFQSRANVSANFSNAHIIADIMPLESVPWLRLSVGGAYLFNANGGASLFPTGNYNVGNYKITNAEVGTLDINVNWKGAAPYAGLSLLNAFPQNRFNINVDLGTYYLKQPRSTIVGTNMLSDNYLLEPRLNSNIKNYRWLPVLQLNFNYKLSSY